MVYLNDCVSNSVLTYLDESTQISLNGEEIHPVKQGISKWSLSVNQFSIYKGINTICLRPYKGSTDYFNSLSACSAFNGALTSNSNSNLFDYITVGCRNDRIFKGYI